MTGDRRTDDALRDIFRALRTEESRSAPEFEAMLLRGRARRKRQRLQIGGAATIAIAAMALFVTLRSVDRSAESGALAAEVLTSHGLWRAPTDFLLEGRRHPLWRSTIRLSEKPTYRGIPQ